MWTEDQAIALQVVNHREQYSCFATQNYQESQWCSSKQKTYTNPFHIDIL